MSRPCGHSVRFCGAIKDAKDSFAHGLNLANRLISGTACVPACVCACVCVVCILYIVSEQRFADRRFVALDRRVACDLLIMAH